MVSVVQEYRFGNKRKEEKLQVGTQIKKYRSDRGFSQEELAEKVYVSRQTVSNWETGKNYPDIHSLLLLSSLFNVSLDQLIKGDVETMRTEIKETEIRKFNFYGTIYGILLIMVIVSVVPLMAWIDLYAIIPWGALVAVTLGVSIKVERLKKDNNISTYKEIVAFTEGKNLDEIEKQQERAKRPYQRVLLAIGSAVIGFIVCYLMAKLFLM